MVLEICCFNLPSCTIAVQAGADRIELCADHAEGGTTPSYGTIRLAREVTRGTPLAREVTRGTPLAREATRGTPLAREATRGTRLYPIIRPRGGDFLYSRDEYDLMALDIETCKELGCDGVVIGGLTPEGHIDKENCARLVKAAGPMGVTFHRAFDRAVDPLKALEDIIDIGCERILTSGGRPTAAEGAPLLKQLVDAAADRIHLMVGGGVRAENIVALQRKTGAMEFHSAALAIIPSRMQFVSPAMQEHLTSVAVNSGEVRQMRLLLDQQT